MGGGGLTRRPPWMSVVEAAQEVVEPPKAFLAFSVSFGVWEVPPLEVLFFFFDNLGMFY